MIRDYLSMLSTPVCWHENSVKELAAWAERNVLEPLGLTLESYSTARMVYRGPHIQTKWVWGCSSVPSLRFGVEELPGALEHLATDNGICLVKAGELDQKVVCPMLQSSCDKIANLAPKLFLSISSLLRTVHILESGERGFDVSFSLPELPNSVFLNIPESTEDVAIPRLMESIVHEVLHLQLSLIDRCCPLVRDGIQEEFVYAPWRGEYRKISGVIHGLFVFQGVEALWLEAAQVRGNAMSDFAQDRVNDIRRQCSLVEPMEYNSLTKFGQQVLTRLTS